MPRSEERGGMAARSEAEVNSLLVYKSPAWKGGVLYYMLEIDPRTGSEQAIAHINPIGFLELRYVLSRWGFRVDVLQTNHFEKKRSLFYQLIRLLLFTKGKKAAALHSSVDEVRQMLLSDVVLFGETLIIGATKVADSG